MKFERKKKDLKIDDLDFKIKVNPLVDFSVDPDFKEIREVETLMQDLASVEKLKNKLDEVKLEEHRKKINNQIEDIKVGFFNKNGFSLEKAVNNFRGRNLIVSGLKKTVEADSSFWLFIESFDSEELSELFFKIKEEASSKLEKK